MMKYIYIIFAFLLALQIQAQQDPQYTQYAYNMNIVNPAYAGSYEGVAIGLLYRSQWVGIEGSPNTGTFAIHSPVGKRVGLGLSIINDKLGPVQETNTYADFSYTLPLANGHKFALGLKAGVTFHDIAIGETNINITDSGDPLFANNINEVTPNFGLGGYVYKPNKYYISLSIPNIINSVYLDVDGRKIGSEIQHLFAAAGYVFNLSNNFKLKPNALLKFAFDAPASFDINTSLFMYNFLEVGLGYRLEDSFSALVNFLILPRLRIGYAYDSIQSQLNIVTNSSHEIFINYDVSFPKRVSRSPRFF